ncbi:DUF885 family protein [Deinococcus marmoris]|uniref:DUF885 domain-containing protein n=1 Tax=Deinococcus marmoris TaxID=249408 RepID=A0A1U7NXC0_9DEIO|nr:DUF885 family protein [Deinococcus marmoris]OLV17575.1 hypothetical protein BOO71_0008245 [Deinococcus marmoris]
MSQLEGWVEQYLALHARFRPVDASFMGLPGHDHQLPPVGAEALEHERAELEAFLSEVGGGAAEPETAGERLDLWLLRSQLRVTLREAQERPRQHNPAFYTGEAAFGVISLLLPNERPTNTDAVLARLKAIPEFLTTGTKTLEQLNLPADWVERARKEAEALEALLLRGLSKHPDYQAEWQEPAVQAAVAVQVFASALEAGNADPACGRDYLEFLMREAHALPFSAAKAEQRAQAAFEALGSELVEMAHELDPAKSWQEQLAALEQQHPPLDDVQATYQDWNARALDAAEGLVTPAREYGLAFEFLPEWAREAAGALYFLFYRSPPAEHPGDGSIYWIFPPGDDTAAYLRGQNIPFIKAVHAVHHGSIGHHTQNARARQAVSRLAQLGGTDCASGIAFLSAGTLVEGWACYAEDLLLEAPGFYTPEEELLLKQFEFRNAACCLADIRLHTGQWTLAQMRAFYRDEVGFAPGRVWAETTRNSIYPATRLMYWLGTQVIRELRAELDLAPQVFHDRLLSYGCAPVTLIADEMRRQHPQGTV